MLKRTCKQCGQEFIISDSEIKFFKSRNLNLPKRCKDCRNANKLAKEEAQTAAALAAETKTAKKPTSKLGIIIVIAFILLFIIGGLVTGEWDKFFNPDNDPLDYSSGPMDTDPLPDDLLDEVHEVSAYKFRSDKLWSDHFDKHGEEVGATSKENYLAMANAVIDNPNVLSKAETDDGNNDTVYFLEATGEFVVLSGDGYIRTYYIADSDYFNRQ